MAWSFNRIVRIDYQSLSDKWYCLVTLNNGEEPQNVTLDDGSIATVGGEESFFLKFDTVPSKKTILVEAAKMVELKNQALKDEATAADIAQAEKYKEGN